MSDRDCLQCGESQAAIRASQQARDPIHCAAVDYFGECEWELPRHRFRDRTDKELTEAWSIAPAYVGHYRRVMSPWEIADEHRSAKWRAEFRKEEDGGA